MATDSTILPQGEAHLDAGTDMSGSELDLTSVQLAQAEPAEWVDLPKGDVVILLPVQPGQTVRLPTDSASGLLAKIGPEGNLAIVVDGRTIILQGYLEANDQTPVKIVTNDGDSIDVAELVAATDTSLDIQTAAGPAAGGQGDGAEGSGIYVPFLAGPGLGGLDALGVLDPTALRYRLIDDEPRPFDLEDGKPQSIEIVPDDGRPTAEDGAFLLDEDFLKSGNQDLPNPSPGDDPGSNVTSGTVVVNFGPDGPRDDNPIVMSGVVNGSESGLFALSPGSTAQGAPILLQLDPPAGGFQVLHGYVGGTEYFTITLNTTTGKFVVEQLEPLWHPAQGTEDNVPLAVDFTAYDATGDSLTATLDLSFDDDSPEIVLGEGTLTLAMDESVSFSQEDYDDLAFPNDGVQDGSTIEGDALFHLFPGMGLPPFPTGWASGNVSGLFAVNFGADKANSLTYALTITNPSTGLTDTATQTPITLSQVGNIVEGRDGHGNLVFAVAIDPNTGEIVSTMYRAIDHGDEEGGLGAHDEVAFLTQGTLGVTATAIDGDGDSQSKTIDISKSISFDDDGPKFVKVFWGFDGDSTHPFNGIGRIDEDKLPNGNYGGPGDDKGGKHADGKVVFDFGADKPGHVDIQALTVKDQLGNVVLGITLDGSGNLVLNPNNLKAIDGKDIVVQKSMDGDNVVWTAYIAGTDTKVFSFSLDTQGHNAGEFDFCLYKPLEHPLTDDPSTDYKTETSYEDNLEFDFTVRGTDGDGDHAEGHVKLSVDDDSPDACKVEISFCDEDNKLVHDETGGVQIGGKWFPWDHDPDASWQPEDDTWYVKDFGKFEQEEHCLDPIGYAKTELKVDLSGGSYDKKAAFGADGPGSVSPVSIVTDCGKSFCGEKTNLTDTKSGCAIYLFTEVVCGETFVVGRVGGKDGEVSFALTISDCGDLELAQYRAIQHPDGCDSDESLKLLDCEGQALIHLQVKVTDADGDAVYARQPVDGCNGNPAIVFQDDGPCVECADGKLVLAMDESVSHSTEDYDDPNYIIRDGSTPEGDVILHVADLLKAVFAGGLPPLPLPIGAAADNVKDLFKVKFGTDGGCEVRYDLTILNAKTNLIDTETGLCVTLSEGPNGSVLGKVGNKLVFAIWVDEDSGDIVSAQYRAIDHGDGEGAPGAHDEVKFLGDDILGVTATAFDKDGDKDSKTVDIGCGISFEDDGPKFEKVDWGRDDDSKNGKGLIDEDALPHGNAGGPGDDQGGKSADGKVVFDFGSDKAGKVEINALEVKAGNNTVLKIVLDAGGNLQVVTNALLAIDNKALAFEKSAPDANGVVTWTAYIAGHPDQKVFTFSLDTKGSNIGEFDFCLHQPLEHPFTDPDSKNNGPETKYEDNFEFDFTVRGYDGDGDSADGHVKLSVDDDTPKVEECEGASLCLAMDESLSLSQQDYDDLNHPNNTPADGSTVEGDVIDNAASVIKAALNGLPVIVPLPIGASADNVQKLFKVDLGADRGAVCYDLKILCEQTNLIDTKSGTPVTLCQAPSGIVYGVDGQGHLVFAVWLDQDSGDIVSVQYRAVDHGGTEQAPGAHDEVLFLGDGFLAVKATATDKDGDKDSETVDIGCGISFDDDGPTTDLNLHHGAKIVLDESVVDHIFDFDLGDPNAGDELFNVSGDIGYAKVPGWLLFSEWTDFGSDGAADSGAKVFALSVGGGNGTPSGLVDAVTNQPIVLVLNNGVVEGRVGDAGGALAFTISVNSGNGEVTVSQKRAVEHDNPSDHDEASSPEVMDAGKVLLNITVTDGDNDSASDSVDLGSIIKFEDDGPKIEEFKLKNVSLVLDETVGGTGNSDDETDSADPDDIGYTTISAASLFSTSVDFGSDGAAAANSKAFALIVGSNPSGLVDTESGENVNLVNNGGVIEGRTANHLVFKVIVGADGSVTVHQYRAVKHDDPNNHDEPGNSAAVMAGNKLLLQMTVTDGDGDTATKSVDLGKIIKFEDDGPIARNDVDNIEEAGINFVASGNVITGANTTSGAAGADDGGTDMPWSVSKLVGYGGSQDNTPVDSFVVNGKYGSLTMGETGIYAYHVNPESIGKVPSGYQEVFTYTLKDADGDTDTATLTIQFPTVTPPECKIGVGAELSGFFKEDAASAIYFSVDPQEADDKVTHVKISGLFGWSGVGGLEVSGVPNAANFNYDAATGTLSFDVTGAGPGETITGYFNAIPPQDSDKDTSLTITATVQDGPVAASGAHSQPMVVDAVLDEFVDVAGADKTAGESAGVQSVNLGLTANFASAGFFASGFGGKDTDGSESHAVKLVFSAALPAGAVVEFNNAYGSVTQDPSDATGKTYLVTPNDPANLDELVASIGLQLPAGFDGTISGQIQSASEEANTPTPPLPASEVPGSGIEQTNADNTKTDSADFSVTVTPSTTVEASAVVNPGGAALLKEDAYGPIALTATPGATDTVTEIKLSNIPAGWDVKTAGGDIVLSSGTVGTVNLVGNVLTIQVVGAAVGAAITATIQVKAAEDSDVDGTGLTVSATAVDGSNTATNSSNFDVTVDAVLDSGHAFGGTPDNAAESGSSQLVDLNFSYSLLPNPHFLHAQAGGNDTDGSEIVQDTKVVITITPGITLEPAVPLPAGANLQFVGGKWEVTALSLADLQTVVSSLQARVPAGFDGTVTGQVQLTTIEKNTPALGSTEPASGLEPDNNDNGVIATSAFNFLVNNQGGGQISGKICFAEDGVFNQYDDTLPQSSTLGSISYASVVTLGLDEALTALTITGIPAGAGLTINGVAVTNGVPLTAGQLTDWKNGIPILVAPADDADNDFVLSFSGTTTDDSSGATTAINGSVTVLVDAAADDPTSVSIDVVSSSGDEEFAQNETGTATITANFGDTDGSEAHTLTIKAPAGFTFTSVADADGLPGPFNGLGTDTVTVTVPNNVTGVDNLVLNVQPPANFVGTPTFSVEAKAVETPTDGGCGPSDTDDTTNNVATETASDDVSFKADVAPANYNDAAAGDEPGQAQNNVMIIFDHSGSMDDDADGNGPGTASRLQLARAAVEALLNKFDVLGDVKVKMVIFATDATAMTFWGTAAEALAFLDNPSNHNSVGSFTSYSDALAAAGAGLSSGNTGKLTDPGAKTTVYFLSDGVPTADGANSGTDDDQAHNLTSGQQTTWNNALETANVDKVFAVGVGSGIPVGDADLAAVANPNGNGNGDPVGSVTIVTNANDLANVLTSTVEGEPIDGNVLDGTNGVENPGTADDEGDGPAHVAYFSYSDPNAGNGDKSVTFTWTGNPGDPLVVFGAAAISTTDHTAVFLTEHGKMTFYFKDVPGHDAGDFEFIPNEISGNANATETFKYYTRDIDGDTEAGAPGNGLPGAGGATLVITINNINQAPVAVNDNANGMEDQIVTIPFATLLGNDTDPDGDSLAIQSVQGAVNGTVQIVGTDVKFTPNAGYFGPASFTYTITDGSLTSTATVNLLIASNNVAPVGNIDHIYTNSTDDVTVQSAWLLANDTDADGDPLSISDVDESDNEVTLDGDGLPTDFAFNLSGNNTDEIDTIDFTYDLTDGEATTTVASQIHRDSDDSIIEGSAGNDIILAVNAAARGGAGDDLIVGYGSSDTLDYSNVGGNWNLALGIGGNGTASVPGQGTDTYLGIENASGGSGNNELTGNSSANALNGNGGNDTLNGGGGADQLNGGDGDDVLVVSESGGTVNDFASVSGGSGNDTLRFGDGASDRTFDLAGNGGNSELGNISSIERIDMTDGSDDDVLQIDTTRLNAVGTGNNIALNVEDVVSLSPGSAFNGDDIDLFILGDAGDHVDVDDPGDWSNLGTAVINSVSFTIYGIDLGGSDDAVMAVKAGVTLT